METSKYTPKADFDIVKDQLQLYCTTLKFQELERRTKDFALGFDLIKTKETVRKLEAKLESYATSADMLDAIDTLKFDHQEQLDGRVTTSQFNTRFTVVEASVSYNETHAQRQIEQMIKHRREVDKTLGRHQTEIDEAKEDSMNRLSLEEGRSLWSNFSKFAVYEDLKDLYKKCVPAVHLFEDKV